jgi:hypothetical protein
MFQLISLPNFDLSDHILEISTSWHVILWFISNTFELELQELVLMVWQILVNFLKACTSCSLPLLSLVVHMLVVLWQKHELNGQLVHMIPVLPVSMADLFPLFFSWMICNLIGVGFVWGGNDAFIWGLGAYVGSDQIEVLVEWLLLLKGINSGSSGYAISTPLRSY